MVKTIKIPISIVELESFTRAASNAMTAEELEEFKVFIGSNPEAGELIRGTGGVRNLLFPQF